MKSVDRLVKNTVGRKLGPLADTEPRSEAYLDDLQQEIKEKLIDGLYAIFAEEHVLSTDEAIQDAYLESIVPQLESLFDFFGVEGYPRDGVENFCNRHIGMLTEDLTDIVEKYKSIDERQYQEQFEAKY